jgi:acetolactate synthase-1/2/3 large subunit
VALQADGSAMYTVQALWTQAREQLDVTTVIINNSAYAILRVEMARTGAGDAAHSQRSGRMLTLTDPTPDFVALATGYGVPARRVETTEDLLDALRWAQGEPGPHLIDAIVPALG